MSSTRTCKQTHQEELLKFIPTLAELDRRLGYGQASVREAERVMTLFETIEFEELPVPDNTFSEKIN